MALRKKIEMQDDVFSGISAVYAVAGGLGNDLSFANATEFPVSDDSGFNFDTGQPSVEHFKVKCMIFTINKNTLHQKCPKPSVNKDFSVNVNIFPS